MSTLPQVRTILAVRLARLGDVALLLPALGLLRNGFPEARVTLVTGLPCAPLARLCPAVDEVRAIDRVRMRDGSRLGALADIMGLIRELRAARFDLAVDFHSFRETNLLVRASGARFRIGMKRSDRAYLPFCFNLDPALEDKSLHVAEMFRNIVLHIPGFETSAPVRAAGPSLRIPTPSSAGDPETTVALYVGASVASRRWPPDRFAQLARHLTRHWDARVVVLGGVSDEEREIAERIGLEAARPDRVSVRAGLGIPALASEIAGADFLVSNDSGPMHIGSVVNVPTLGIFSESQPRHYRPIGPEDRFVRSDRVGDIGVGEVVRVLEEMRAAILASPDRPPGS